MGRITALLEGNVSAQQQSYELLLPYDNHRAASGIPGDHNRNILMLLRQGSHGASWSMSKSSLTAHVIMSYGVKTFFNFMVFMLMKMIDTR